MGIRKDARVGAADLHMDLDIVSIPEVAETGINLNFLRDMAAEQDAKTT